MKSYVSSNVNLGQIEGWNLKLMNGNPGQQKDRNPDQIANGNTSKLY